MTIASFIFALYLLQQFLYFLTLLRTSQTSSADDDALPTIAICMAARDEEGCIANSIESLLKLDYPKSKLSIWIADDQSSDQTAEIIKKFAHENEHLNYYLVEHQFDKIRGKQNALANVIKLSDTEMIAIVDADITVKPSWLKELVASMKPETAIVCGSTTVQPKNSFLSTIQNYDWVYLSLMLKVHSDLGYPISGIGNNMLVRRSCYTEAGGYESMRFSIIEDFLLYHELCVKRDYNYAHVMSSGSTNISQPSSSYAKVIEQRYRWARGSRKVPKFHLFAFFLPTLTGIVILGSFAVSVPFALTLLVSRCIIDAPVRMISCRRMQQPSKLWFIPIWHLTTISTALLIGLCPFRKNKVQWKGRKI